MTDLMATCIMLALLAACLATDIRAGKIYNLVTVPCALAGLALGFVADGWPGIGDRLLAMATVLFAVMLLAPLARLGGGDTKLLMAIGALQGFHFVLWAMLLTGVAGGVLALIVMARKRVIRRTATNLVANMIAKTAGVATDLAAGSAVGTIPYTLAIVPGVLAALLLGM